MKTFWKITLLLWGLTFCNAQNQEKPAAQREKNQWVAGLKITHSCDGFATSKPTNKS